LLDNSDIRGLVDDRNEKIGKKIREAELAKTPFMLIVGEQEQDGNLVSVRSKADGDLGSMDIESFADLVKKAVKNELEKND
jgi:threonyl-tRNA synthetase